SSPDHTGGQSGGRHHCGLEPLSAVANVLRKSSLSRKRLRAGAEKRGIMNTLSTILIYGIAGSVLISAVLLGMLAVNPRLMLPDYPKDVQAAVPPKTRQDKRQTLYRGLLFWLLLLGLPIASALSANAAHAGRLEIYL